jgi:branched-chain amino acid transport system ATP-binding protein
MMLEVHDLQVRYGPIRAVKRLELSVRDGSVVGLLGANGAGKSTTLRAISGLVPYTGRILFNGEDCRKLGVEGVVRRGIIHVPEGRRLFSSLTVHENLQVGAAARGGRQADYEMGDVYELFPALVPLRQRPGWALSGGEQQMVALGRALVAAPRLLLLDEPSLGLSPKLTVTVYRALAEIARATSILLVEQQTALALRICGRATVLSAGVAVLEGSSGELSNRELLMDSYLGQARVHGGVGDAARPPGPDG